MSNFEYTKAKAERQALKDFENGKPCAPKAKIGSAWFTWYTKAYEVAKQRSASNEK